MTMLPDPIREALTAGHLAHLATINPDGSPPPSTTKCSLDPGLPRSTGFAPT